MKKAVRRIVGNKVYSALSQMYRDPRVQILLGRPLPEKYSNLVNDSLILCNLCGTVFPRSEPIHSEFLICPSCGASARNRVMIALLLQEVYGQNHFYPPLFHQARRMKAVRLLECSPKANSYRREIFEQTLGSYTASDYAMSMHNAEVKLDVTDESDVAHFLNAFDVILFAHILEHIPEYSCALSNLYRMLAPGGFLLLQVPLLEARTIQVTWDEFHDDNTRVFHRFGFELTFELDKYFDSVTPVVGQFDFPITSPEISKEKYLALDPIRNRCNVLGEELVRYYGLGIPDLCDAFVCRKQGNTSGSKE